MVVGALSFLGSRTAAHLAASGTQVQAVAHDHDIDVDELLWYRKQQLENMGLHIKVANFSNQTQVALLLGKHPPTSVVYIPPAMNKEGQMQPRNDLWSKYLEEFVMLLEALRTQSPCSRVLLTSLSKHHGLATPDHVTSHMTILQAWMETFELTASTYHNLYNIPFTVLRTSGVYGPWGESALGDSTQNWCWYIGDVTRAIQNALRLSSKCEVLDLHDCSWRRQNGREPSSLQEDHRYTLTMLNMTDLEPQDRGIRKTLLWASSYVQQRNEKRHNVIFTSYFTTTEDSQRNRKKAPSRFQYMKDWYWSVKKQQLRAVVFHDGLDARFRQRLMRHYPAVTFHYIPSLQHRSTNDARFYAYLAYLDSHPEVDRVMLTDISDVRFQMNPFLLVDMLGDWLYTGTDIDIFPSMRTMPWINQRLQNCFSNYSVRAGDLHTLMDLDTVYNAGVMGGARHTVMALLTRIVQYLDNAPPHLNCNMPAVNYAIHKHFFDRVFTGFPLTSRFLRRQTAPKGVYIVHK